MSATTTKEPPLLADLRGMDPYTFEHLVADVWSQLGYQTEVSQASNDMGVDVIAHGGGEKIAMQVKRYAESNTVGGPKIQQYSALRQQEDADAVIVVTTGYFTEQALELADRLHVDVLNGPALCGLMADEGIDEWIIEKYFGGGMSPRRTSRSDAPLLSIEGFFQLLAGGLCGLYLFSMSGLILAYNGIRPPDPLAGWLVALGANGQPGLIGYGVAALGISAIVFWRAGWLWKLGVGVFIGVFALMGAGLLQESLSAVEFDILALGLYLLPVVLAVTYALPAYQKLGGYVPVAWAKGKLDSN